jgi:glycosyltransferase involved in cell wall biosynthesis
MSVSFIVTVYNKRPFLPVVLPAVAAECADVGGEIIIVDDGSTDGSGEILERFCATNPACRLIRQANAGPPAAVNAGFRAATMPYVRPIDADDIPVRSSTRVMLEALKGASAGLIAGEKETYDLKTLDVHQLCSIDPALRHKVTILADPLYETIRNNELVPSITLMTRSVAEAMIPLPDNSFTCQDFLMVLRAAQVGPVAKLAAVVCYFALAAENRVSAAIPNMYHDTAVVLRQYMTGPDAWPGRHRRFALRRNAGRALLYARRHLGFKPGLWLALFLVRLAGYLPLYVLYPALLTFLARTYRSQLVRRPSSANLGLAARQDLHNLAAKTKA